MYLPDELEREKQQKIYKRELIEDGTLFKRQLTVWRADLNLKQPGWEPQPLKGRVPSYRSHYSYCFDPSLGRFFMHGGLSMNKELKMVWDYGVVWMGEDHTRLVFFEHVIGLALLSVLAWIALAKGTTSLANTLNIALFGFFFWGAFPILGELP